ncbi:MAG TPA: methyltransferase domain-containing protein [Gemmatimonadales bacterium]|nr:methyltransferase domain-containing protein [Gemmatimonadales bacterium]
MTEWFEQWFGEEYHALYPHRDEDDARRAVALIRRVAPWRPADRVLDLACGSGRHAAELERSGARVLGFDLSPPMLRRARARTGAPLVRGDMRALPFLPGTFALAVNLFTSFGYFRDDAEHALVLRQVAAALAAGGRFVLDYLNAEAVRRSLRPTEERRAGGRVVRITRRVSLEGRFVVKEIELPGEGRTFQERVRLYGVEELTALLAGAGFTVTACFGDYSGAPGGPDAPRVILVGTKAGKGTGDA